MQKTGYQAVPRRRDDQQRPHLDQGGDEGGLDELKERILAAWGRDTILLWLTGGC